MNVKRREERGRTLSTLLKKMERKNGKGRAKSSAF